MRQLAMHYHYRGNKSKDEGTRDRIAITISDELFPLNIHVYFMILDHKPTFSDNDSNSLLL